MRRAIILFLGTAMMALGLALITGNIFFNGVTVGLGVGLMIASTLNADSSME